MWFGCKVESIEALTVELNNKLSTSSYLMGEDPDLYRTFVYLDPMDPQIPWLLEISFPRIHHVILSAAEADPLLLCSFSVQSHDCRASGPQRDRNNKATLCVKDSPLDVTRRPQPAIKTRH